MKGVSVVFARAKEYALKIRCLIQAHTTPELFFSNSVVPLMKLVGQYLAIVSILVSQMAGLAVGQVDSLGQGRAYGLQVVLTNSGFGLGGYVSSDIALGQRLSFEVILGAAKDEREVAFFDRLGSRDVPNKANYLLEVPLQVGLEQRLFKSQIEDNFRPFLFASAGPLIGWAYPYFDDANNNNVLDSNEKSFDVISGLGRGHVEPGVSVGLFLGAHFGSPKTTSQGVRIGYRLSYYKNPIALLEESIKTPSRRIGTPVISVYFGRVRGL